MICGMRQKEIDSSVLIRYTIDIARSVSLRFIRYAGIRKWNRIQRNNTYTIKRGDHYVRFRIWNNL